MPNPNPKPNQATMRMIVLKLCCLLALLVSPSLASDADPIVSGSGIHDADGSALEKENHRGRQLAAVDEPLNDKPSNANDDLYAIENDSSFDLKVTSLRQNQKTNDQGQPTSRRTQELFPGTDYTFSQCANDVFQADVNNDGFISRNEEYLRLVNNIGAAFCFEQTGNLTATQQSAYYTLACQVVIPCFLDSEIPVSGLSSAQIINICNVTKGKIFDRCPPPNVPPSPPVPPPSSTPRPRPPSTAPPFPSPEPPTPLVSRRTNQQKQ